ncbi:MAG TPA: DNA polymerase I [Syntrophales bacterium]|nr:DNA polymerase I [Syntrophales bacterium]
MTEKTKPTLYLIDGSNYAYRAFFAIQGLANSRGFPTNAVYGFNNMLTKLLRDHKPEHIAVVFDAKGPTFRSESYEQYKAHRKPMPDELKPQFGVIKDLVRAYRIPLLEIEGIEADDVIGTLARKFEGEGVRVVIVSGDKDLMQLVSGNVVMIDTMKDKTYDIAGVEERFGVGPGKVADILGLMGDTSDNIPGVPGVGPKRALELIKEYGTVEGVLQNVDKIRNERLRKAIAEHADQARLSRELATVRIDAEVDLSMESARYAGPDREVLKAIFKEMEFSSLIQDLEVRDRAQGGQYRLIGTEEELHDLVGRLHEAGEFSLHLELTSDLPMFAELAGIALSMKPAEAFYVPFETGKARPGKALDRDRALGMLLPVLSSEKIRKDGHDLKNALIVLARLGVSLRGAGGDTMVGSYLLNPSKKSHDIIEVAREFLDRELIPAKEIFGSGAKALSPADVDPDRLKEFAGERADATLRLSPILSGRIRDLGLDDLYRKVELPLVEVLALMEQKGVLIDLKLLHEMSGHFETLLSQSEERIYGLAGEHFNINSPKQLQAILFDKLKLAKGRKTKEGYSTDVEVLTTLALTHDLPAEILAYRSISKLKSTYIDALPAIVHPQTGRIHTSYNQTVTATGRLSSSNPNLQNIPIRTSEGKRIRQAFIAPEGFVLVSADYSQIELHVLAHLSGDEALIDVFEAGEDIHTRTASALFGVFPEMVSPDMRRRAKVINFGVIYGMSPFGLSKELGIGQPEAKDYIDNYFDRYRGVRRFLDEILENARRDKYVCTLLNRRRYIPEIASSNSAIRQFAERTAINAPIQGTAADLIKIAMINLHHLLKKHHPKTSMIMQVHDELVFEVPEAERDDVMALVKREMEGVVKLRVPLKVEIAAGKNWDEAH